ncbi:hypothetical protein SUGI_1173190 [Cryptomeria japonica]|nr:hypothetical protein SUGI_1173190 [Cryptomeria japonica]
MWDLQHSSAEASTEHSGAITLSDNIPPQMVLNIADERKSFCGKLPGYDFSPVLYLSTINLSAQSEKKLGGLTEVSADFSPMQMTAAMREGRRSLGGTESWCAPDP